MFNYKDRVVMITVASSGLGVQMAHGFAEVGANLAILARREERLKEVKEEIESKYGLEVFYHKSNVTNTEDIDKAVTSIINHFGKIDVLVNNAGSSKGGPVNELSDEDWQFTMDIDLTSVFNVTRRVSQEMIKKEHGRIINIASIYGLLGTNQMQTAYHATKAGVVNFSRAASAELAPKGITVNTICPGYFTTELTEDTLSNNDFKTYMNLTVPMHRPSKQGELNAGAIFLGSVEASYVTGIALPID
ncbi:SDR family NAD(P)-dependent oxidoreductase [Helcococcus bovis]|uniref:SDR family NAD(P)-dependent oxidoreductase n=1 Tax=Helcococcus bovis TaxID=3153252 RepID=A0ABW9F7H8_9FIRM